MAKLTSAEKAAALQRVSLKKPVHCLALGLGSGLAPKAPGTWGSLAALPVAWLFLQGGDAWLLVAVLIGTLLGFFLCEQTAKDMQVHDHGAIVWDEWVGMWITLCWVPVGWATWLAAFVLFRFFDILKPWPIRWLDKNMDGGLGIMLDDVLAGLMAWCCLQYLLYLGLLG